MNIERPQPIPVPGPRLAGQRPGQPFTPVEIANLEAQALNADLAAVRETETVAAMADAVERVSQVVQQLIADGQLSPVSATELVTEIMEAAQASLEMAAATRRRVIAADNLEHRLRFPRQA